MTAKESEKHSQIQTSVRNVKCKKGKKMREKQNTTAELEREKKASALQITEH